MLREIERLLRLLVAQGQENEQLTRFLLALAQENNTLTLAQLNELRHIDRRLRDIEQDIDRILDILTPATANSGTVTFGGKMDITVHVSDVPQVASAHEWTGPLGTGVEVPPIGAITWTSDNAASVTVDQNTGQLAYVAAGIANISFADAGNSITGSGSVTVVADVAVSGTVTFA